MEAFKLMAELRRSLGLSSTPYQAFTFISDDWMI